MKNWIFGLVVTCGVLLAGVAQAGNPWGGGYGGGYGASAYGIRHGGCYRPVPNHHHHHTHRPNIGFWYSGYNGGFGGNWGGGYGGYGGYGGGCFPHW